MFSGVSRFLHLRRIVDSTSCLSDAFRRNVHICIRASCCAWAPFMVAVFPRHFRIFAVVYPAAFAFGDGMCLLAAAWACDPMGVVFVV